MSILVFQYSRVRRAHRPSVDYVEVRVVPRRAFLEGARASIGAADELISDLDDDDVAADRVSGRVGSSARSPSGGSHRLG